MGSAAQCLAPQGQHGAKRSSDEIDCRLAVRVSVVSGSESCMGNALASLFYFFIFGVAICPQRSSVCVREIYIERGWGGERGCGEREVLKETGQSREAA